jgi:hypothetical protein
MKKTLPVLFLLRLRIPVIFLITMTMTLAFSPAQSQTVTTGRSYINITRPNGGTFLPGDIIERSVQLSPLQVEATPVLQG